MRRLETPRIRADWDTNDKGNVVFALELVFIPGKREHRLLVQEEQGLRWYIVPPELEMWAMHTTMVDDGSFFPCHIEFGWIEDEVGPYAEFIDA
jgi:hypothetical protein